MKNKSRKEFKNPIHPGEILLHEFLLPMKLTQSELANRLGWTKAKLNELIKGKRGVTAESALDLSEILKTSPKIWLNMQVSYDLAKAEKGRRSA